MNVSVEGGRTFSTDWDAVRSIPPDQLPVLTPEQKQVAKKLGWTEEQYAQNILAQSRTSDRLLEKTARFARFLADRVKDIRTGATIETVNLNTREGRFEVEMTVDGHARPFRVSEELVDQVFENGSPEAEKRLLRVLELALKYRGME